MTYDNLSRGFRSAVQWGPLEVGALDDRDRLRTVLEKYRPAAVMHFAAFAYVGESVEQPELYQHNNVQGSFALFDTILQYRPIPVIFSSSCVTYGVPQSVPITEDHPQQPINPYGETKLQVERKLIELGTTHNLPWVALRYFNAAGSDPDGNIGEDHNPETHLIPLVLLAARDGKSVRILGTDYDTPDGTCIRDYVHVVDIADAHVRALDYLFQGGKSCALNLANARGYSVKEVIATAEQVCGRAIAIEAAARRPGDPPILVGSADRARGLLGWKPARPELQTQITDAWRWFKSRA